MDRFVKEFGEHPSDVVVCASMSHIEQWQKVAKELTAAGLRVKSPNSSEHASWDSLSDDEVARQKAPYVREHIAYIACTGSVLVCNYEKNGVQNYVGANSFMEMTAAYLLDKPIFLLNAVPQAINRDEILAMQPTILNGDIQSLILYLQEGES